MPHPSIAFLHQRACLWEYARADRHGDPIHTPAIEIPVRWEEGRAQAVDPQGNKINIDATAQVAQEVAVNDLMWLGKLKDLLPQPQDVKEVVGFDFTPDIKGRNIQRNVYLRNYAGAIQIPGTGT